MVARSTISPRHPVARLSIDIKLDSETWSFASVISARVGETRATRCRDFLSSSKNERVCL